MSTAKQKPRRPKPPVSDAVRRMRFIDKQKPPVCCDEPMEPTFLNCGDVHGEGLANLSEREHAEYIQKHAVLPPIWACKKCDNEMEIAGLDWPDPGSEVDENEIDKTSLQMKFCPHCGKELLP